MKSPKHADEVEKLLPATARGLHAVGAGSVLARVPSGPAAAVSTTPLPDGVAVVALAAGLHFGNAQPRDASEDGGLSAVRWVGMRVLLTAYGPLSTAHACGCIGVPACG